MAGTDIDRLRQHLGGVKIGAMNGDNLAITLCTHFDDPDEEIEDETCWGPSALNGANATLDAIHAYYATALTERDAQIERLTRERKDFAQTISEWATKAGEAEGRLKASEWPGVVEGWKDRATTAERDLAEARAEVERKDAALKRIESWEPATQEMTLAHQMAAEARAALKPEEVAKGEISGNTIRNTPGAGFLFEPDRAGLIAGLRECAELAGKHAADGANLDERSALLILAQDIRARITALEEEGKP